MQWLRKNKAWTFLLAVTATYLVWIVWLRGPDVLWRFLSLVADLNSVGDFLAGVFAPLAFIWLAAAVVTQRQELAEARQQFKDSQDVITKQLANADKQAAIIAKQQANAEAAAERAYKLSLYQPRNAVLFSLNDFRTRFEKNADWPTMLSDFDEIRLTALFLFPDDVAIWFKGMREELSEIVEMIGDDSLISRAALVSNTEYAQAKINLFLNLRQENLYRIFHKHMNVSDRNISAVSTDHSGAANTY